MADERRISREETERIAHLARVALTGDELDAMTAQMNQILEYVRVLEGLDVSGVEPTAHASARPTPLRADVVEPSLPVEEALKNAPRRDEAAFVVPKVV